MLKQEHSWLQLEGGMDSAPQGELDRVSGGRGGEEGSGPHLNEHGAPQSLLHLTLGSTSNSQQGLGHALSLLRVSGFLLWESEC